MMKTNPVVIEIPLLAVAPGIQNVVNIPKSANKILRSAKRIIGNKFSISDIVPV